MVSVLMEYCLDPLEVRRTPSMFEAHLQCKNKLLIFRLVIIHTGQPYLNVHTFYKFNDVYLYKIAPPIAPLKVKGAFEAKKTPIIFL